MAKQKGIIKLEGKIGDLSFLKTKDGYSAKEKGGIDGDKIKNDDAFERTRENMAEFATAANAGQLLRHAVRELTVQASDRRMISRVVQLMADIKNLDPHSDRGRRSVAIGMQDPVAKIMLKGFNFNSASGLASICIIEPEVNPSTGEVSLSGLVTGRHLSWPKSATHVHFQSGWARVDFESGSRKSVFSPIVSLPKNLQVNDVSLLPSAVPALATGTDLFLLLIEFYQEINGQAYALNNGAYNALGIVEVA